jgi:HTH-type transcriptional regulator/antitoxin HigA
MIEESSFLPQWCSPPGETISDLLSKRGITFADFARRMHASSDWVYELANGVAEIDQAVAAQLQAVLGPSSAFWVKREQQYRDDLTRLNLSIESGREWVRQFPISDMIKFGWIERATKLDEKVDACLRFFGVPNVLAWKSMYAGELSVAAFRASPAFASNPRATSAWLRWAALESEQIACRDWRSERFEKALLEIRALTRLKDPGSFLPDLKRVCADCGVALVVAPAPSGCRASGATRFLTKQKAMIALTFRYRLDDQFWFTFFHEAGHLLLHGKTALFLEDGSEVTSKEENEANEFAGKILVPDIFRERLMNLRLHHRDIIRFARTIGVSPGIVVGQLQFRKRVRPDRLNGLKRRFDWNEIMSS